jgi:tetratricopeptide (TPR) repeat protein
MLSGALAASFAAALVSLQFQSFTMPTALFWYVNAALLAVLAPPCAGAPGRRWRLPRMASAAATVCAAGLLIVFAVRLLVADRSLALIKGRLDNGQIEAAIAEHKRVLQWQPPGMNAELWYSRSLLQAAHKPGAGLLGPMAYREALDAAIRATSSSEERHNAYYNLAAVCAVWNDLPRTIESLRAAIAAAPTWYKSHWVLAQVLGASGRLKEADAEASLAVDLCGGKHPEVIRTREELRKSLQNR